MTAPRPLRSPRPTAETTADPLGMTGQEILQGTLDGRFPGAPLLRTLGFRLAEFGAGTVVFEGEPRDQLFDPAGGMYGGFVATLLESALGAAVLTRLAGGTRSTSVKIGIDIHRAVRGDTGTLRCEGTALHVGPTTASAEARLIGAEDGDLYAHATSMYAVLRMV
ncbi:hotdog fold thioesterase [Nocardia sp. R7R-8]|uniref:hotdog fold thioesterase n=1 Tax=Nocardia sp. R7R-8 TaxID=3459304 RepID=UPI00403D9910